jgi:hypothetical protein
MNRPELFFMLSDGDIVGIRHIAIMTWVGEGADKRCELILSNGGKKRLTKKEAESIQSTMMNECMVLMV